MENRKTNWMTKTVFWVAVVAIVICAIGIIVPCFNIKEENSIITFIGVLATFVVISNFSQVADIRNNTENELGRMRKIMVDNKNKMDERLDKMKGELNEKVEVLSKKIDRIDQKVDAALSGELDIVAIKEKYKYEVKDITLIENAVFGRYYVVEFDNQSPVIAYVQGKKNDLNVEEVAYNKYMKRFPNKDDFDRMNSILGPLGIK